MEFRAFAEGIYPAIGRTLHAYGHHIPREVFSQTFVQYDAVCEDVASFDYVQRPSVNTLYPFTAAPQN